ALIAQAGQQSLRAMGVQTELVTMEWTTYLDFVRRPVEDNEVEIALLGWGVATMDADYALVEMFHSRQWPPAGFNLGFYHNPAVDAALDEGRFNADPEARLAAYAEAQRLIWEDAPWIFLHSELQLTGLRANIEGFVVHPTERYLAHQAEKRRRRSDTERAGGGRAGRFARPRLSLRRLAACCLTLREGCCMRYRRC